MRAQADIRGKLGQGTDGEEWRAAGSRQHVIMKRMRKQKQSSCGEVILLFHVALSAGACQTPFRRSSEAVPDIPDYPAI